MASDDDKPSRKSGVNSSVALILGALVGGGIALQALLAFRHDGWGAMVQRGSHSHFISYSWWLETPFELVFMGICLWALVAPGRKP